MFVTVLDLETSGLDPAVDRITEIGVVLWDVQRRKPVAFHSLLIKPYGTQIPLSLEVAKLTGISDDYCMAYGFDLGFALQLVGDFVRDSDAMVIHGGLSLDKPLLVKEYSEHIGPFPEIPWVDTMVDFAYPEHMKMRSLSYLAADHRYTLDFAHRALPDALATAYIASHYDIPAAVELAKHPIIKVHAGVDYNTKDEAKSRGYFYDNNSRSWFKNIRSCLLEHERSKCPFVVTPVS